jgi:hypothetical protein
MIRVFRQVFTCGKDRICIRHRYDGLKVLEMKEIDPELPLEDGETFLSPMEVDGQTFRGLINNKFLS